MIRFKNFYTYLTEEKLDNWKDLQNKYPELKNAVEVMDIINNAGFEVMIVGGACRDLIMGNKPNDIDLTTNATPDQVKKIFGKVIDIGKNKEMGVTVVPYKGQNIEIATYRKDIYDVLGNAKGADRVEITTSFKDDTSRRDFTINSLGIDKDGNIVDHHGGIKDIKNKIIAAVGDPNIRFKEDALRLLRSIRFASKLGFNIDQKTIEAIKSNAPEINKIASERILKELWKMAEQSGYKFAQAIIMLKDLNLLQYILPEVFNLKDFKHSTKHHPEGHPFEHTIEALKTYKGNDPIVNFSILLHDVGKTRTYKLSDEGDHTYHGHAEQSSKIVEEIGKRLKMDNKTIEAIKFAVENHMKVSEIPNMNNSTVAKLMQSPYFDILLQTAKADWMARGSLYDEKDWNEVINKINKVKEISKDKDVINSIKKVVNGNLIMKLRPDIPQGPLMGKIIKNTVEWILDNNIDLNDIETIENFIKKI